MSSTGAKLLGLGTLLVSPFLLAWAFKSRHFIPLGSFEERPWWWMEQFGIILPPPELAALGAWYNPTTNQIMPPEVTWSATGTHEGERDWTEEQIKLGTPLQPAEVIDPSTGKTIIIPY